MYSVGLLNPWFLTFRNGAMCMVSEGGTVITGTMMRFVVGLTNCIAGCVALFDTSKQKGEATNEDLYFVRLPFRD